MKLVGTLGDLIQKALSTEGRTSRHGLYKTTRKQREKNRARNARRERRVLTRARRPEAFR